MSGILKYLAPGGPMIYFSGYGFEERTARVLQTIAGQACFQHAFTVGYPSSFLGSTLLWKQNKAFIDDRLAEMSTNFEVISISVKQPVEVRQNLRAKMKSLGLNLSHFTTIVDITSFPKSTLFMLLKELAESRASGYLFYVEPLDYELPISLGVKDIRTLPFFGDDYNPTKQKLLIQILGFEGLRAYAVWETLDPHRTIALIGEPATENRRWKTISEGENRLLLSRSNVETRTLSFTNVQEGIETLESIYDEVGVKYNVIVTSLGTKLSAVSLFYFANRHKNVFLTFSRPEQHTEHYSHGSSRLVVLTFDHESARVVDSYSFPGQ